MSLLKPCLDEIAKAIALTANKISKEESEKAISMLMKCSKEKSKLIISGVGKSGIVKRKIAATFSSIGLVSIFLNPLDAFHGDLGVVSEGDVCILLSNSGETKELIELCPHIKNRGAFFNWYSWEIFIIYRKAMRHNFRLFYRQRNLPS